MLIFLLVGLVFPRLVALSVWFFSQADVVANDFWGILGLIFLPYTLLAHITTRVLPIDDTAAWVLVLIGVLVDLGYLRLFKN